MTKNSDAGAPSTAASAKSERQSPQTSTKEAVRRQIPGNLVYLAGYGYIKNVLNKIIPASVPEKFSQDYLSTVLNYSGGGYRQVIPVLKRVGFLAGDGKPTELYSKFRTEGGRSAAAYQGLKNGFGELFKRNEHIYAADDAKLVDKIIEVTGLPRNDGIVQAIKGTFRVFSGYLPDGFSPTEYAAESLPPSMLNPDLDNSTESRERGQFPQSIQGSKLNLSYNINIVLPDTKDIEVFNAIFCSIKGNLLS